MFVVWMVLVSQVFSIIFLYQYIKKQIFLYKLYKNLDSLTYDGSVISKFFIKHYFFIKDPKVINKYIKVIKIRVCNKTEARIFIKTDKCKTKSYILRSQKFNSKYESTVFSFIINEIDNKWDRSIAIM